jgi:hypothetical protein
MHERRLGWFSAGRTPGRHPGPKRRQRRGSRYLPRWSAHVDDVAIGGDAQLLMGTTYTADLHGLPEHLERFLLRFARRADRHALVAVFAALLTCMRFGNALSALTSYPGQAVHSEDLDCSLPVVRVIRSRRRLLIAATDRDRWTCRRVCSRRRRNRSCAPCTRAVHRDARAPRQELS